jgi:hypothetical protein
MSTIPAPQFETALAAALAPLDRMMPQRQRAEALARAQREILAAAAVALAAERRRVVQMTTAAELRREVRALLDSHGALLDQLDEIERVPVIAPSCGGCASAARSGGSSDQRGRSPKPPSGLLAPSVCKIPGEP